MLAAGAGVRLGVGRPKGLVRVSGRSLLRWCAEALAYAPSVCAILPVIPPEAEAEPLDLPPARIGGTRVLSPVPGGSTRQASVARGLLAAESVVPELDWVLVHDAARCLVSPDDAEQVLDRARETGAAIPVVPIGDTLKEVVGERVVRTLDRDTLVAVQTPQAFRRAILREALDKAEGDGFVGTDCASVVERLGIPVRTCPGRRGNWKVTHPEDLARAEAVLSKRGRNS